MIVTMKIRDYLKNFFLIIFIATLIIWEFDFLDFFGVEGEKIWPIIYFIMAVGCGLALYLSFIDEKADLNGIWPLLGLLLFLLLFTYSILPEDYKELLSFISIFDK